MDNRGPRIVSRCYALKRILVILKREGNNDLKIGELVRTSFNTLIRENLLTKEKVVLLIDKKYCKETFDMNYAVLKRIQRNTPLIEQRQVNSYSRYYARPLSILGEDYLLCNDWYDRNRPYLNRWLESMNVQFSKI